MLEQVIADSYVDQSEQVITVNHEMLENRIQAQVMFQSIYERFAVTQLPVPSDIVQIPGGQSHK